MKQNFSFLMKQDFINHIKTQKKYAQHTLEAYQRDLDHLELYLLNSFETTLADAGPDMLRSWIVQLVEHDYAKSSIQRKLSSAKSFYNFLINRGGITKNPAKLIKIPGKEKKLPVFLTENQTELLTREEHFADSFEGLRDRLIIEMLYQTGMRRAELVALEEKSIDFYNQTLKVTGKRNKQRIIPLNKKLLSLVNKYTDLRGDFIKENITDAFFVTKKGEAIYSKLVYRVVNHYLQQVSTATKKSPHVLRHTFATHMLNNGADINAVKEILGHSSLAATQVYTHNTIDKIKLIYKQAHPRA